MSGVLPSGGWLRVRACSCRTLPSAASSRSKMGGWPPEIECELTKNKHYLFGRSRPTFVFHYLANFIGFQEMPILSEIDGNTEICPSDGGRESKKTGKKK